MDKKIHSYISSALVEYNVVGISSPAESERKLDILLSCKYGIERQCYVIIDAIRCSSTLISCLAANVKYISIQFKGGKKGPTVAEASALADRLGLQFYLGGELNGQPLAGGIIGNSPTEPPLHPELDRSYLHFSSTNFGAIYCDITNGIQGIEAGIKPKIVVATFSNIDAVTEYIKGGFFDTVIFCCGAFYNSISLEDEIVAGAIIDQLGFKPEQHDDSARLMLMSFNSHPNVESQLAALKSNWITKSLEQFGKGDDLQTVLTGYNMPADHWRKMKTIVPTVKWCGKTPLLSI